MKKKEALKEFKELILPDVVKRYGNTDLVAMREAWNNWTDVLYKDRRITYRQYETWTSPFCDTRSVFVC